MNLIDCIEHLEDEGLIDTSDAKKEIAIILDALDNSKNALLDYVDRLERRGSVMGYGRSTIAKVERALNILEQ